MTAVFLALAATAAVAPAAAQDTAATPRTTAEIRIDLPEDAAPRVSMEPGARVIALELPRGAVFPLDFEGSSGGLLRGGAVTPIEGDRVRLELELAQGLLDRVEYAPGGIVLRFTSRFASRPEALAGESSYVLGVEDRILVTVHNHPELSSSLTVSADGTITAPYVGAVRAAGQSPERLAERLAELLGRDYLVDPQIDVAVEQYRSQWVMVNGEVRLPQRVPLRGGTRLKEVLSEAGGFTEDAGTEIIVSRQTEAGGAERLALDRVAFERGEVNPLLESGDIVDVPAVRFCYVQGEVRSPGPVRVMRDLTLTKALAIAGGMTDWAKPKEVRVIVEGEQGSTVQVYNVRRILTGKDEDPLLRGGESVVVPRRYF